MENIDQLLFQILITFQNSPEFNSSIQQLPPCLNKCTFFYIKQIIAAGNQNYRIPIELINNIRQQNIKNLTYSSILHYLLIQVHEHTIRHCKLEETNCAYHKVFNLKYEIQHTCKCFFKSEINDIKSFDFIIETKNFVKVPQDRVFTIATWKKYLKQSFEDNILILIKNGVSCPSLGCEFVPETSYSFNSISSEFIFSINYSECPSSRETLRLFSMFPKNLNLTEDGKPFEIFSYLLLSGNTYGSLQYFKALGHWVLVQGMQKVTGKYDDLVEMIIRSEFFPIHVFYSSSYIGVEDFRGNKFYSIQCQSNILSPNLRKVELGLGVENRVQEESLENYWVCECNIINYFETCVFCGKKMFKNHLWTCVCLKKSEGAKCSCGRQKPSCSLCKELFSWKTIYCLRCNGGIKGGKCRVCNFNQSKFICPKCVSEFWRCGVCLFPNKDTALCVRCSNPNEKKFNVNRDMPEFISFNFDD